MALQPQQVNTSTTEVMTKGICTWHGIKGYAIYLYEEKYYITRYGGVVETCNTLEEVSKRYVALAWGSEAQA